MNTLYLHFYRTESPQRRAEIHACIRKNIAHPFFDRIVILAPEVCQDPQLQSSKTLWLNAPGDPRNDRFLSVGRLCDCINQLTTSPEDINVLAHSDIYFDDSLSNLISLDLSGACIALTPFDLPVNGASPAACSGETFHCWIFQGRIHPLTDADFAFGLPQNQQRFIWELRHADYHVTNPSRTIRTYHMHQSFVGASKISKEAHRVKVPPCMLAESGLKEKKASSTGLIAFSLFGQHPKYVLGAVENARIAKHIYPGWTTRFYVDDTIPAPVIRQLRDLNAEIVMMPHGDGLSGMFWRFLAIDDPGFPRWMIRDADSRLNYRERRAVDEWIASGLSFHTMRDHPKHRRPIMGCAFGGIRGALSMAEIISSWEKKGAYGDDELMLAEVVFPLVCSSMLVHDSFSTQYNELIRPFPSEYENYRFVGERFDANERHNYADRCALLAAIAERTAGSPAVPGPRAHAGACAS